MGNYSDARRQMIEAEIRCPNPQCRATNEHGKEKTIRVDVHNEAWCSKCGKEWPVEQ